MYRKLDTSITVVHKEIDCIKARLEAKATALEGRINKGKAGDNNDRDLIRKNMKELRGKVR
jgi:hypothetical protein